MSAQTLSQQYLKAMIAGNIDRCIRIEQDSGLYGYPPELVSVGLKAIDEGHDGALAVLDYIADNPEPTP